MRIDLLVISLYALLPYQIRCYGYNVQAPDDADPQLSTPTGLC
jgi:hypothetical protein